MSGLSLVCFPDFSLFLKRNDVSSILSASGYHLIPDVREFKKLKLDNNQPKNKKSKGK